MELEKIKIKTIKEERCEVRFSVKVPGEVVQEKREDVTKKFQKEAQIDGFRTGRIPIEIVRKKFSSEIKSKTEDWIFRDLIPEILEERSISPVVIPIIYNLKYDGPTESPNLSFDLVVERNPKFEVKNYRDIPVHKKIREGKDRDIEMGLKEIQERNSRLVPSKESVVKSNHFVLIDYQGFFEGKEIPELKIKNQLIDLSTPQYLEGLAETIIGSSPGETKEITIQLPKEYPCKNLAEKSVLFKVNLKEIKEKVLPNLDDEFAKDLGLSSLDELRGKMAKSLKESFEISSISEMKNQICDYLVQENSISVPNSIVGVQLKYLVDLSLARIKIDPEKLEEAKTTLEQKYRADAERHVKISYLLDKIARQENIMATADDLKKEMEKAKNDRPGKSREIEQYFQEHSTSILNQITEDKVMKFLLEHARIVYA